MLLKQFRDGNHAPSFWGIAFLAGNLQRSAAIRKFRTDTCFFFGNFLDEDPLNSRLPGFFTIRYGQRWGTVEIFGPVAAVAAVARGLAGARTLRLPNSTIITSKDLKVVNNFRQALKKMLLGLSLFFIQWGMKGTLSLE